MLYKKTGMRIREQRLQQKMTQQELAEKADISLSFMGHIERGTRKASWETMCAIAEALNCSLDGLAGRKAGYTPTQQELIDALVSLQIAEAQGQRL